MIEIAPCSFGDESESICGMMHTECHNSIIIRIDELVSMLNTLWYASQYGDRGYICRCERLSNLVTFIMFVVIFKHDSIICHERQGKNIKLDIFIMKNLRFWCPCTEFAHRCLRNILSIYRTKSAIAVQ